MKQSLQPVSYPPLAKAFDLKNMDEELRAALAVQQEIQFDALKRQELQMLRERVLHEAMIRREIASLRQQATSAGDRLPAQLEAALSAAQESSMHSIQDSEGQRTLEEALLVESLLRRKRTLDEFSASRNQMHNDLSVEAVMNAPALMYQSLLLKQLQDQQNRVQLPNPILRFPQAGAVDSYPQRKQQLLQPSFAMVADKPSEKAVSFHEDVLKKSVLLKPKFGGSNHQPPFKKRKISTISHIGNSFPLPSIKEQKDKDLTASDTTKLISYQCLWGKLGQSRFQAELFRRKLASGTVSLTGRTRSPIVLMKMELNGLSTGTATPPFYQHV